jgi:hypothetical protein
MSLPLFRSELSACAYKYDATKVAITILTHVVTKNESTVGPANDERLSQVFGWDYGVDVTRPYLAIVITLQSCGFVRGRVTTQIDDYDTEFLKDG